jgi:hypothetical protein
MAERQLQNDYTQPKSSDERMDEMNRFCYSSELLMSINIQKKKKG